MSKYRDLARKALNNKKQLINENLLYPEGITERMHPKLEEDLRNNKHSLAECNIFPEGDVLTTEMKLIRERFKEVVKRCREAFDMEEVDNRVIMSEQMKLVTEAMQMESEHIEKLEQLAVEMVMEEFDIPEGSLIFEAKLKREISDSGTNETPIESLDETFNDTEEISRANEEVKKRRVLNAMTQGASKSVNHMFHMVHEPLTDMNPRLPNVYKKMMSAADMMYYIIPDMDKGVRGGRCEVDHNEDEDGNLKPVIKAEAMVFPVLIHELCKGVMEVLSMHGLPTEENIAKYVIDKADFLQAEPWDMRFGPAIWRRFCNCIPVDDFNLKHHVYADVAAMEPSEFNMTMKEIIANTKRGQHLVSEMIKNIKKEIEEDDFNEAMGDNYFNLEDLY
jgi:hypothetical protein